MCEERIPQAFQAVLKAPVDLPLWVKGALSQGHLGSRASAGSWDRPSVGRPVLLWLTSPWRPLCPPRAPHGSPVEPTPPPRAQTDCVGDVKWAGFLRMFVDCRDRGRERERDVGVGEKHQLVASRKHPDWGWNLQPFGVQTL